MNTAHLIKDDTSVLIDMAYDALEGAEDLIRYHRLHGTPSLLVLTQYSPKVAQETTRLLSDDIKDKVVIEVGAGVGFLAIEMAKIAKQVYAIEVDCAWSWIFTHSLYDHKPPNLTWIFGTAESMVGILKGDIVVICTHSGQKEMRHIADKFAPKVITPLLDDFKLDDIKMPKER
jgi:tRNA G37 N-methylase Trm5